MAKFGDLDIQVKGIKRRTLKRLRKEGMDLFAVDGAEAIKAIDEVIDETYPDLIEQIDDMEYPEVVKLFQATFQKTMGTEDEIKNS